MDANGHEDRSETVGFVGLGRMGWPMAANLARAGYGLVVRDADRDVEMRFANEFGAVPGRDASAFASAGAVITMLPDGRVVQDAVLGDGIADALSGGAVVVDMSSSSPHDTRALGAELARRSIALIDAPVSGGVPRATDGTLAIMAGADDEAALERALPLLDVLGRRVFRTGPLASGHAMKALNNFCAAAGYAALAEALVLGREFGLAPSTMVEIVNNSTGRSFISEVVFAAGGHHRPLPHRLRARATGEGRDDRRRRSLRVHPPPRRCASSCSGAGRRPRRRSGSPPITRWHTRSGGTSTCLTPVG